MFELSVCIAYFNGIMYFTTGAGRLGTSLRILKFFASEKAVESLCRYSTCSFSYFLRGNKLDILLSANLWFEEPSGFHDRFHKYYLIYFSGFKFMKQL